MYEGKPLLDTTNREAGKSIRSKAVAKAEGCAVASEVLAAQVAKCRGKLRGFRSGGWYSKIGGIKNLELKKSWSIKVIESKTF